MEAITRITFLDDAQEKFFGEGPCRLLREVERTGSLRSAAGSMGMAYSKALRLVKHAEAVLGFPLTTRTTGGVSGGGSRLTPEGLEWLQRYEAYRDACVEANAQLYHRFFQKSAGRIGCVIMASGMGSRFGGNKLLAPFRGQPLISRILDATQGCFTRRVVVTRYDEIAALCAARGIECVLHDLPSRSDTVRLGLEALGDVTHCMFCPGDMPLLRRETVQQLLASAMDAPEAICRPAWDGQPGAPVVFPQWAFPELLTLPQGKGGGYVLANHPEKVQLLPVSDEWELRDADTPEALSLLEAHCTIPES